MNPTTTTVSSSVLGAISGNADPDIIAQLCGFDPLELLNSVNFPNDRYERLLRISKDARQCAMRREDIPLSDVDEELGESSANVNLLGSPAAESRRPSVSLKLETKNGLQAAQNAISDAKTKENDILREQLARSAASIVIQSLFRGILVRRKYLAVKHHRLTIESHDTETEISLRGLPGVLDLTIQERLLRKYKQFCKVFESINHYLPDFPYFCASKIQATYRMSVFRRKWIHLRDMSHQDRYGDVGREAANAIIRRAERADYKVATFVKAVVMIQRSWRRYSDRKVFKFYRNLIKFRESGNPSTLLKFVNPTESKMIDAASSAHIRFRLGGMSFPPTIYYKIYVHSRLIDMNSFSPRDYTKVKQKLPRELFVKGVDESSPLEDKTSKDGWYERFENNGWRPIVHRNWREDLDDEVVTKTAEKTLHFHHLKAKRRQDIEKRKKQRKLEWMTKMYQEGRKLAEFTKKGVSFEENETRKFEAEEDLMDAIAILEAEVEHDLLYKWSVALDFDSYSQSWLELSTTGNSDDIKSFKSALVDVSPDFVKLAETKAHNDVKSGHKKENTEDNGADMLAEIDLFNKIVKDTGLMAEEDETKKPRPWSGNSSHSLHDLYLTDRRSEDF